MAPPRPRPPVDLAVGRPLPPRSGGGLTPAATYVGLCGGGRRRRGILLLLGNVNAAKEHHSLSAPSPSAGGRFTHEARLQGSRGPHPAGHVGSQHVTGGP